MYDLGPYLAFGCLYEHRHFDLICCCSFSCSKKAGDRIDGKLEDQKKALAMVLDNLLCRAHCLDGNRKNTSHASGFIFHCFDRIDCYDSSDTTKSF